LAAKPSRFGCSCSSEIEAGGWTAPTDSQVECRLLTLPGSKGSRETEKEIRITAELPGVTEQDIDISLDDDVLTIHGGKKFERKDDKENFHFVERSYGTFQRSLRLPFPVDPDQVQASFENGVLTVTVPKTGRQERSRRIQVPGRGAGGQSTQNAQGDQGSRGAGGEGRKQGKAGASEQTSDPNSG
jgi:HSP20 family protein